MLPDPPTPPPGFGSCLIWDWSKLPPPPLSSALYCIGLGLVLAGIYTQRLHSPDAIRAGGRPVAQPHLGPLRIGAAVLLVAALLGGGALRPPAHTQRVAVPTRHTRHPRHRQGRCAWKRGTCSYASTRDTMGVDTVIYNSHPSIYLRRCRRMHAWLPQSPRRPAPPRRGTARSRRCTHPAPAAHRVASRRALDTGTATHV